MGGESSLRLAIFGSFIWILRAKYRMGIFFGDTYFMDKPAFLIFDQFFGDGGRVNSRYWGQAYVAIKIWPPGISAILINWTSQNLRIVGRYFTFLFIFFWTFRKYCRTPSDAEDLFLLCLPLFH